MDKEEVIFRLKEHLKCAMNRKGNITWHDKWYCTNYIMDFLFCDRKKAKKILEDEVLMCE